MTKLEGLLSLDQLRVENQRVLVRLHLDAELDQERLTDESDLELALGTVAFLRQAGARQLLLLELASKGAPSASPPSLEPLGARLAELLSTEIYLPDDCVGDAARKVASELRPGQIGLLENLGAHPEEGRNEEGLARRLSGLCDAFVNDAFSIAHRTLASTVTLPRLLGRRAMGARFQREAESLSRVSDPTQGPLLLLLGGDDERRQLTLLELCLDRCQAIAIGGALSQSVASRDHAAEALAPRRRALFERARDRRIEVLFSSNPTSDSDLESVAQWAGRSGRVLVLGSVGHGAVRLAELLAGLPTFTAWLGDRESVLGLRAHPEIVERLGVVSTAEDAGLEFFTGRRLPALEALRGGEA